jgi:Fe-S cluster assembly protein SufB
VSDSTNTIETFANQEYKWGFVTDIEADAIPRGLSEDVVRLISAKKNEPEWLLEWRLKAYRHWLTLKEPEWANVHYPKIDYQDIIYYSSPKPKGDAPKSLDEVDPRAPQDLRQARHPPTGAGDACRRRRRCRFRQRFRCHHLQGQVA